MTAFRHFIESHFGLVLLLSCAVGLVAPLSNVPDDSASLALAMLTYASCFKLRDGGFSDINWKDVAWFYIARYIILPVILFSIAHVIVPNYALGIFLLALVPAAVSSPAFAHMFGGRVPPAFAIVIVSTLLAPFLIPLQFMWASEVAMDISPLGLFKTLAFCIFLPMALYLVTKFLSRDAFLSEQGEARSGGGLGVKTTIQRKDYTLRANVAVRTLKWEGYMYDNVKVISIVLVAFVIALVIAKQRDVILGDIPALLTPTIAAFACYAIFMLCAKWLGRNQPRDVQITYMVCSGFNNVALGVSLALLHFPAKIILLVAVSEMAWSTLPIMMKLLLRRASAS